MVVSCRAVRSPRRRGPQLRGEPRGALLDGVLDRVADAAILAGLGLLLVAVGAPLAALAAVTATSALSLGPRVVFLRRPRGA